MLKNILRIRTSLTTRLKSTECKYRQAPVRFGALAFSKYLLLTNTISSGTLMLIGDLLQQEIEYNQQKLRKRYDYGRLSRMFMIGLVIGPLNHYFYEWLAQIMPQRNIATATKKMILDQVIMSPISIAIFFYGLGFMESKSIRECNKEFKKKFLEVFLMDVTVCLPAQFLNFYYVPVKYQVFYVNSIAVLYSMCLSYFKHADKENI